jgi:thiol-disulfide isomerase/thioredoxin
MSTRKRERRSPAFLFTVVALVIVGALVIALVRNGNHSSVKTTQTDPVTLTGSSLPAYNDGAAADLAVGQTIPAVSGTNLLTGAPMQITNDGKAKVIAFVAHWCPHCQREVPLLAPDLRAHPLPANVEMYTVSTAVTSSGPNYPPTKWLEGVDWPTPVMADSANNDAANAFGLSAYPYFVFVNGHNQVVARTSGEITLDQFHALVQRASVG